MMTSKSSTPEAKRPTSSSSSRHQTQHHPLGSEERFKEDQKLTQVRRKEIDARREAAFKTQHTFAPKVSTSRTSSPVTSATTASDDQNNNSSQQQTSSSSPSAARKDDVVARLQQSEVNRRQRLELALKEAEEKRNQGFTFKPKIDPISARTATLNQQQQEAAFKQYYSSKKNNQREETEEGDQQNNDQEQDLNNSSMCSLKVEDRLMREGRLAEARRQRMKQELAKQELALLNVGRSSSKENRREHNNSNNADHDEEQQEDPRPLWQRLQESDRLAKENRERLRTYLENQYPFKPSINHVSAATVSLHQEEKNDGDEKNNTTAENDQQGDVVHRLYDESMKNRSQHARQRQEQEAAMRNRQYTFQPRVSLRSAQLAVKRAASQGGGTFTQRQQHAEACRQEHISVMKEAMKIKEEKDKMQHKFSGYGKHMDPSEMSNHVKRMATSVEQRELRLKELAERSTAAECPFQPVTTKRSSDIVARKFNSTTSGGDVVKRMELERQRASSNSVRRKMMMNADETSSSNADNNDTASTAGQQQQVMSASRLQEFLDHQQEHLRKKEAKVLEMRHQLVNDEIAGCTFRPETNYHDGQPSSNNTSFSSNQQQQSVGAATNLHYRSSSRNRTSSSNNNNNNTVDDQVRGMEAVRARVALAAKLKAEQAEREAKAWGIQNNGTNRDQSSTISISRRGRSSSSVNTSSVSIPRCAISSFDYPSSVSQQRQKKYHHGGNSMNNNNTKRGRSSSVDHQSTANDLITTEDEDTTTTTKTVVVDPPTAKTVNVNLLTVNQKRQMHRQQQQQQIQQQQQQSKLEDDELEEIEYPTTHHHNQRQQEAAPRQRSARDVMTRGAAAASAGLLPQHLLEDYEKEWMMKQQQQQHRNTSDHHHHLEEISDEHQQFDDNNSSHRQEAAAAASIKSSTPRMGLKKRHQNLHYVEQDNRQSPIGKNSNNISPSKKKTAALDLALRRHIASDHAAMTGRK